MSRLLPQKAQRRLNLSQRKNPNLQKNCKNTALHKSLRGYRRCWIGCELLKVVYKTQTANA